MIVRNKLDRDSGHYLESPLLVSASATQNKDADGECYGAN